MSLPWTELVSVGAWGGLLAIERRGFLQAMLSRPLVAASVTGALLDDVAAGLFVGLLLELYYLDTAALGASAPDNDTLAATGAAAFAGGAYAAGAESAPSTWALAVLVGVGLGPLGKYLERLGERYAARLQRQATRSAAEGALASSMRRHLRGLWPSFVLFGLISALCVALGSLSADGLRALPPAIVRGLGWAAPAMASVAAARAVRAAHAPRAWVWALAATALAVLLGAGALWPAGGPGGA